LEQQIEELILSKQIKCEEDQRRIELATIQQAGNQNWHKEREGRITASNAGPLYSLKDCSNNHSTLKRLLHKNSLGSLPSIQHGIMYEGQARRVYENRTGESYGLLMHACKMLSIGDLYFSGYKVKECGIFISLENGIFAATPDGLVEEDGIVEIKCPISLIGFPLSEMATKMKCSYLIPHPNKSGELMLRRSNAYYYQVTV
jgi:hypothetical protein